MDTETLKFLLKRPIAFHRVFVDITGSILAALFLSQLFYWSGRVPLNDKNERPRNGWFYKTIEEWEKETGLNYNEQFNARKRLIKLDLLYEKKKSIPAKLWYRLDVEKLLELIELTTPRTTNFDESKVSRNKKGKFSKVRKAVIPEDGKQVSPRARDKVFGPRCSITESTSETSPESTSNISTQPTAMGGGKNGDHALRVRLSFEDEFGLAWTNAHEQLIPEERAVAIMKSEGIKDSGVARHIIGEWAGMSMRGFNGGDPVSALIWSCRQAVDPNRSLALTRDGEGNLPKWR